MNLCQYVNGKLYRVPEYVVQQNTQYVNKRWVEEGWAEVVTRLGG